MAKQSPARPFWSAIKDPSLSNQIKINSVQRHLEKDNKTCKLVLLGLASWVAR